MFEQYGSDFSQKSLNIHNLLPAVNQSEAANSMLGMFQQWLTKPEVQDVAGVIASYKTPLATAIDESIPTRQHRQLLPVITIKQGEETKIYDLEDVLRKLQHLGVDSSQFSTWGKTEYASFLPPIDFDKLLNWSDYCWVDYTLSSTPEYVTIISTANNSWGVSNRWKRRVDLVSSDFPYATDAVLPIIEYQDVELNEWVRVTHKWQKYDPIRGNYQSTDATPSIAEINSSSFLTTWRLVVGAETVTPTTSYTRTDLRPVYTVTTGLPQYVIGTSSVDVVMFDPATGRETQFYGFVEETDTSIAIIDDLPPNVELRICVGASIDEEMGLHRVLTTTSTGNLEYHNLTTTRFIGQHKKVLNQQPVFNLYYPNGEFYSTGFVWRYKTFDTQAIHSVLQQRIDHDYLSEDFEFETDMADDNQLYAVKVSSLLTTLWRNVSTSTPTSHMISGEQVWDTPCFFSSNPKRETKTTHWLSELTPHISAVQRGESTIRMGHDASNLIVSSTVATKLSIPALLDFVVKRRDEVIKTYYTNSIEVILDILTNVNFADVVDLPVMVFDRITAELQFQNDQTNAFVNTKSYNPITKVGIPNALLTYGQMGLVALTPPSAPYMVGDSWKVPSHEQYLSTVVEHTVALSTLHRKAIESAVGKISRIQHTPSPPIPLTNQALWRNTTSGAISKFVVTFYDVNPPSAPTVNQTWFDSLNNVVQTWDGSVWQNTPLAQAWKQVDFLKIIVELIALVEQQLYNRAVELAPSPIYNHYASVWGLDLASNQQKLQKKLEGIAETTTVGSYEFLRILFEKNPIDFVDAMILPYSLHVNGLRLNPKTSRPFTSTDMLLHASGYEDPTFFQIVPSLARYEKIDAVHSSSITEWANWTTQLAYESGTLLVPDTIKIYSDCTELQSFQVALKRSFNHKRVDFSNILITLNRAGLDSDLYNKGGVGWKFTIASSVHFDRPIKRYGVLSQTVVWDTVTQVFVSADPTKFTSGQAVALGGVELYVRVVTPTKIQLCTTEAHALDPVGSYVAYDSVGGIPQLVRQVDSTFTVASLGSATVDWVNTSVNRSEVIEFEFPVVVDGIGGLIDFVNGYHTYMTDAGMVFNDGETPQTTPTGVVINWQQQLSAAISKLYQSRGLTGRDFKHVGAITDELILDVPYIELNPFARSVGVFTPEGVLTNIFDAPYPKEWDSIPSLYDERGRSLIEYITPLRTGRITSLVYEPPTTQFDNLVEPTVLKRIGGGTLYFDWYEHVILFADTDAAGSTVFDRFYDLTKSLLNVEFQRSIKHYGRPSMGGFVVTPSSVQPNFETIADYQRNDTNPTLSNELIPSTFDTRLGYGKVPQEYFKNIPVTTKTEFRFWQRMIREKGTTESIRRFGKHKLYDDFQVGDFWAWKLGTFGSCDERVQYEMSLNYDFTRSHVATVCMMDSTPSIQTNYPIFQAFPTDDTKWYDYPTFLNSLGTEPYVKLPNIRKVSSVGLFSITPIPGVSIYQPQLHHVVNTASLEVENILIVSTTTTQIPPSKTIDLNSISLQDGESVCGFVGSTYVATHIIGTTVTIDGVVGDTVTLIRYVQFSNVTITHRQPTTLEIGGLVNVADVLNVRVLECVADAIGSSCVVIYEHINSNLLKVHTCTSSDSNVWLLKIYQNTPLYDAISPLRIIDSSSKLVETQYLAWDPAIGVHTTAVAEVNCISQNNPAVYGTSSLTTSIDSMWGKPQVGKLWWDTTTTLYKPYADTIRSSFDEGTEIWGQIYDNLQPRVYQWIETSVKPSLLSASEEFQPYYHTLTKTRAYVHCVSIATTSAKTTFNTSAVVPFIDGATVALYDVTGVKLVGAEYATEYVIADVTPTSFALKLNGAYISIPEYPGIGLQLICADADWENYQWVRIDPIIERVFVYENNSTRDFLITNPEIINRVGVDQYLQVWVNGQQAAFVFDETTHILNIVDPSWTEVAIPTILDLRLCDEVVVLCEPTEPNVSSPPTLDTMLNTVVMREIPYTKLTTQIQQQPVTLYYFWVRGLNTKQLEIDITKPRDTRSFGVRSLIPNDSDGEYQVLQIRGVSNITTPNFKRLCIDYDPTLRSTLTQKSRSITHEKWVLMRETQATKIPKELWKQITQAIMGIDVDVWELTDGATIVLVPSKVRTVYDYFNSANSRFGTEPGQVLYPTADIRSLFVTIFTNTNDVSHTIADLVKTINFGDTTSVYNLLRMIYNTAESSVVNKFVFLVIRMGLFAGYQYDKIFKTSYISIEADQRVISSNTLI